MHRQRPQRGSSGPATGAPSSRSDLAKEAAARGSQAESSSSGERVRRRLRQPNGPDGGGAGRARGRGDPTRAARATCSPREPPTGRRTRGKPPARQRGEPRPRGAGRRPSAAERATAEPRPAPRGPAPATGSFLAGRRGVRSSCGRASTRTACHCLGARRWVRRYPTPTGIDARVAGSPTAWPLHAPGGPRGCRLGLRAQRRWASVWRATRPSPTRPRAPTTTPRSRERPGATSSPLHPARWAQPCVPELRRGP